MDAQLWCRKHDVPFDYIPRRIFDGTACAPIRRCPVCVDKARAKVRLERERYCRAHNLPRATFNPKASHGIAP